MSYSYSYKSSSSTPQGSNYSYESSGPQGSSSYSYRSSSSGSAGGVPLAGAHSSSMDAEMERMKREAEMMMGGGGGGGSSSHSYQSSTHSSSGMSGLHPVHEPSRHSNTGSKKVVTTTTTTRVNPQATREIEALERDFSRIGKTPEGYQDDFEKIRNEILTGEAYKGGAHTTSAPVVTKYREEHTRSAQGSDGGLSHQSPTIIPVVDNSGSSSSSTHTTTTKTFSSSSGREPTVTEEVVTRTTSGGQQQYPGGSHSTTTTGSFIPISTSDHSFDDFHMGRFMDHQDQFHRHPEFDLETQRLAWNNRLGGIRSGFFDFPSHHQTSALQDVDSSKTVSKNPVGRPEFAVQFDMKGFRPDDLNITMKFGKLVIKAVHEEKSGGSVSRREFSRTVDLPSGVQTNLMRAVYSKDGVLSITAPIQSTDEGGEDVITATDVPKSSNAPPLRRTSLATEEDRRLEINTLTSANGYQPASDPSQSYTSTPETKLNTNLSTSQAPAPKGDVSFNHYMSVPGFRSQDLNITISGRKVKVHGKHQETSSLGRSTYNEFRRMFDLPPSVEPGCVQAYIKDSRTLFITANVNIDDIEGDLDIVNINKE